MGGKSNNGNPLSGSLLVAVLQGKKDPADVMVPGRL